MKYEKNLAVLAGLTFAGSLVQAQIAIGETLTVSGFADASYVNNDDGTETSDFGIDQVEVDLAFSLEAVTAEVHLQTNRWISLIRTSFRKHQPWRHHRQCGPYA